VEEPGEGQTLVNVVVQPPDQIRLAHRKYERLIFRYLQDQRVRAA
jgi:hypothetical protein